MKLGLYVGSFNPVHLDHLRIAKALIRTKVVDKVLFVPTKNYWDKKELIDIKHRIKMLKLCESKNILVDDKRNNYDYTYQIIASLKAEVEQVEIYLIIGADNMEKFHAWRNIDKILENKIIVINRNGLDVTKYINNFKQSKQFITIKLNTKDIAATEIREKIKNQQVLTGLLDQQVIEYIKKENLYQ